MGRTAEVAGVVYSECEECHACKLTPEQVAKGEVRCSECWEHQYEIDADAMADENY